MVPHPPACPRCRGPLSAPQWNTGRFAPCVTCAAPTRVEVFPALFRPIAAGATGELILAEGEAGCFYHPQKRAAVHCQSCGRFLCALCDVDLNGQHLCSACLEAGQRKNKIIDFEHKRFLFDSAALSLAVVPLVLWPFTLLTAPLAVGLAIYGWNRSKSVLPRTHARAVLAILIGLGEMVGWGFIFYAISIAA